MSIRAILCILTALAIALLAPLPLPIERMIPSTPGIAQRSVSFVWRPAGLLGLVGDNPWVYAISTGTTGERRVIAKVWADTPCAGAIRLSKQLSLTPPQCSDAL